MNPSHDPFQQPQSQSGGGDVPPNTTGVFPDPSRPSIQPQPVAGEPLYDQTPGAVPVQPGVYAAPQPFAAPPQQTPAVSAPSVPQPVNPQQPVNTPPSPYVLPPKPSKLWMVIAIILMVIVLGIGGGFIWSMLQYIDQRDNVDSKVTAAVATAVKDQADKDAAAFLEKEKQPNRLFVGPDDYGRLSFNYPKTWSTYVHKDAVRGGTYESYLNPVIVPPVGTANQQFALRVLIEEKDYDKVVEGYKNLVQKGDLVSTSVKADDQNGTRLDGQFTKDIKGSAVLFKIRDKTVTLRTDADVFKTDFDALIKTITFNK